MERRDRPAERRVRRQPERGEYRRWKRPDWRLDATLSNITFNVGALTIGAQADATPASLISVTGDVFGSGVTIDNTSPGGNFPSQGGSNIFVSGLDTYRQVDFTGTINVGSGDAEIVRIAPASDRSGLFQRQRRDQSDGNGRQSSGDDRRAGRPQRHVSGRRLRQLRDRHAQFRPLLCRGAGQQRKCAIEWRRRQFHLANNSQLLVINTIFTRATVTFEDGTGELVLGQDGSGLFQFGNIVVGNGGAVAGLRAADVVALEESETSTIPVSLNYAYQNNGLGVLTVYDSATQDNDTRIGQIAISDPTGSFTTANFVGSQSSYTSTGGFAGE